MCNVTLFAEKSPENGFSECLYGHIRPSSDMGKLVAEALAISGMALIGLLAYVPLSSGSWPVLVTQSKRSVTAGTHQHDNSD